MQAIRNIPLENVLFLDIETVPQAANYDDLDESSQSLWDLKAQFMMRNDPEKTPADFYERAGIFAEFGKIVCISVGFIPVGDGPRKFRVKSFAGHEEKELLEGFANMLNTHYNHDRYYLCGHNGKEFDFPFMARRMLINGLKLPLLLDTAGRKPWEVKHLDTMELWKFGDYKSFTSIKLLTHCFGIPTPKDDIDGSQVASVYYGEGDVERIAVYCQKDTLTVAQLYLRYLGEPLINPEDVIDSN